jgi:WhiB family redox-sensing transcriptional regulator
MTGPQLRPDAAPAPYGWGDEAECARRINRVPVHDPELFFPVGSGADAAQQTRVAKRVCWSACTVRQECLEFALDSGIVDGIWGGRSEDDRKEIIARRKAQRRRERQRERSQQERQTSGRPVYVDAAATRAVFQGAARIGYSIRETCRATGISEFVIRAVLDGQAHVQADTQEKALAATFHRIGANA